MTDDIRDVCSWVSADLGILRALPAPNTCTHRVCRCGSKRAIVCGLGGDRRVYVKRGVHDGKLCAKLQDLHRSDATAHTRAANANSYRRTTDARTRCSATNTAAHRCAAHAHTVKYDDRTHRVCRCGSKRAIVCGLGGDRRVHVKRGVHDGKLCEKLQDLHRSHTTARRCSANANSYRRTAISTARRCSCCRASWEQWQRHRV